MMPEVSIYKLLSEKPIYVLCPDMENAKSLFQILTMCNDMCWASKRKISTDSMQWNFADDGTAYEFRFHDNDVVYDPRKGRPKYNEPTIRLRYTHLEDPDIQKGHVFTVEAFIDYLKSQGATSFMPYSLDFDND